MDEKIFGDYELLQKIGEGGFGEVYLAEHRFIKKKYALKVFDIEPNEKQEFVEKFKKDINALVSLDHPSIVKVHNISQFQDKFYLVMDYIAKDSQKPMNLAQYLSSQSTVLPEAQLEAILRQIASALDYAHSVMLEEGPLVHSALKFSNILVDPTEQGVRVYLSDFATSRLFHQEKGFLKIYENFLKKLTKQRQEILDVSFMNDYAFLSPEQKSNTTISELAIAIDVYAFGVLAYFLIARDFPEGYFDLPSMIAPEYKLNWDLFVCRCLQKNPEKRPEKLTEALNTLLSKDVSDLASLDILSWEEVEKKVENAMQMSFEFSSEDIQETKKAFVSENTTKEIPKIFQKPSENAIPKPLIKPKEIERPIYEPDPGAIFNKELNVSYYQPKKVEIKEVEPLLTEMIIVPAGSYFRGSNEGARDEMPNHKITMTSFALDIHPVTNEQFVRFLQSMGGEKDHNNNDIVRLRDSRINKNAGKFSIESGYTKHPVVGVTWYGAMAYSKWVGKRLPTEAEWEIACLGGQESASFPTGSSIDHTQANFFSSDTTAVKSYPANGYGLYDMVGNVYEWCEDWYAYNYYDISQQEPEDPKGPHQGVYRVLRGGCWKSLKEDLRCSHRHRNNPGTVNGTYGFRCAADVG